jgi:hypothetical protein
MKYIGDLIEEVRRDTRNEDEPTSTEQVGISTEDFLRYANFALEKAFAIIIATKPTAYEASKTIDLIVGRMEYTIPDRVYLNESIKDVKYSNSGEDRDFHEIREISLSRRRDIDGVVTNYIRHAGKLILTPKNNITGAKIRATYDRQPDSLDLRRGVISASTLSSTQLTALTLDTSTVDDTAMARAQYLCINDSFGNVTMYNIPITSYDATTGVVTLDAFTFAAGETASVGDYVTIGEYTTTHCKLNQIVERYISQYMEYRIFRRDSADDAKQSKQDMDETIAELRLAYADVPKDEIDIQIDNDELMLTFHGED